MAMEYNIIQSRNEAGRLAGWLAVAAIAATASLKPPFLLGILYAVWKRGFI
jgi:hypothetical protein